MKLTKKLLSMLLTLALLAVMAVPAFAAGEGSIVINNAVDGHIYTAYKILDLESYNDEFPDDDVDGQYSYKIVEAWSDFFAGDGSEYVTIENGYVISWVTGKDPATFAKLALTYAEGNDIAGVEKTADGTNVTFNGLDLGYYLVDTSLGSLCSLGTTDNVAEITEKNDVPDIKKEQNAESNIVGVGETVNYTLTVSAKKGAKKYIVHDSMTTGLTFDDNVKVSVNSTEIDAENYTVVKSGLCAGCTFHIEFKQSYLDTITENTDLVITYSATINENAVTVDKMNNRAKLDYSNEFDTEWKETESKTLKFKVKKTDGTDVIDGAEFELYDALTGGNKINLVKTADGEYRVATKAETEAEDFKSAIITAGEVTIKGLNDQDYYLEETKAPDGYNKLKAREKVELSNNTGTVIEKEVVNKSGTELPSTGGMGTTLFYLGGGAMFLGALVLLVTKKRMKD